MGYADIRGFSRRVRPTIDDLPPGISQHLQDLFLQFKSFVVCTNRHDARFLWVLNRRLIIRRDQPHFLLPYQIACQWRHNRIGHRINRIATAVDRGFDQLFRHQTRRRVNRLRYRVPL